MTSQQNLLAWRGSLLGKKEIPAKQAQEARFIRRPKYTGCPNGPILKQLVFFMNAAQQDAMSITLYRYVEKQFLGFTLKPTFSGYLQAKTAQREMHFKWNLKRN